MRLGFIGAGNMAEALCRGIISSGVLQENEIIAADVSSARRDHFGRKFRVAVTADNEEVVKESQTVIFAVKPQNMPEVLEQVGPLFAAEQLIISIAAGISTAFIEKFLKEETPVIRAMPNTPMLVGSGMAAIARGKHAREQDSAAARRLLESAAAVIEVEENLIDAVTALSGSGPAYFFYLIEAMIEAGVSEGLSPEDALKLAGRTCLGAAKLLLESGESPQELRRKVTSPGGTTSAAISSMEGDKVRAAVVKAVKAAAARSRELGK